MLMSFWRWRISRHAGGGQAVGLMIDLRWKGNPYCLLPVDVGYVDICPRVVSRQTQAVENLEVGNKARVQMSSCQQVLSLPHMPLDPDDGMPPLVDNPNPSLTYTFYSEMTRSLPSPATQSSSLSNPPSPLAPDDSTTLPMLHTRSHGKRRDPSYIPRPSNAFILFRSAFIRDRKVSDKVEGNHSSLSKIIGHSWKKLSPDEREKWEAEAVAAQAQHRAMYPDWRFRPGANALAKLKIKDGGMPTPRRRSARVKDPPNEATDDDVVDVGQGGKGKEKGKGRNRASGRITSLEEMRCAKIADFVADGIRGEELEVAVKQWEGDRKMGKEKSQRQRLSRSRVASPVSTPERIIQTSPTGTHSDVRERRGSVSFSIPSGTAPTIFNTPREHLTWQDAENQRRIEEMQEPNSWWGDSRSADVEPSTFGYHDKARTCTSDITTTTMGYENSSGSHFDSGYIEYVSFDSPHDGSQNVDWTDMSNGTDRHGLSIVLENPYKDDGNSSNSPHTATPPTIYAPPLSSSFYYTQAPPPPTPSPLPPSSFSTLTGWAGDYKVQTSNSKAWPDHPPLLTSEPPSASSSVSPSSNWYSPDGALQWGGGARHLEQGHCSSLDSQDWDRLEYRAASDLHLAVESLQPVTFQDEIRRLQGGSSS